MSAPTILQPARATALGGVPPSFDFYMEPERGMRPHLQRIASYAASISSDASTVLRGDARPSYAASDSSDTLVELTHASVTMPQSVCISMSRRGAWRLQDEHSAWQPPLHRLMLRAARPVGQHADGVRVGDASAVGHRRACAPKLGLKLCFVAGGLLCVGGAVGGFGAYQDPAAGLASGLFIGAVFISCYRVYATMSQATCAGQRASTRVNRARQSVLPT